MFDSEIFAHFATRRPGEGRDPILVAKQNVSALRDVYEN
jgi:hypothetical protein